MADRGYGSLDLMETIRDSNSDFLIRVQEKFIKETIEMPMKELDTTITLTICTNQTKEINELRDQGKIKRLIGPSKFGKPKKNVSLFHSSPYVMKLRIVRLKLSTGSFETIATSLDPEKFPPAVIKELYHLRWGIETSFRTLKYAIGLTNFHARKEEFIKQEIYARLLMFNYCSRIANSVIVEQDNNKKYEYKINFTQAIHICFSCLKHESANIDIRDLIRKFIEPIRPGREDERKMRIKSVVFFTYRVT